METAEQFYKGVTTSKNNQHRADAKRNSCGKKKKEEDPPRHPTLRRSALTSTRVIM